VFLPDNDPTTHGIRVFDAATGTQLTSKRLICGA
jgi:hypothetical protein